jgi:tripartite-type tricarboxylate transporter receptor subunit TctC
MNTPNPLRRTIIQSAILFPTLGLTTHTFAQSNWPKKPIHILVPNPAGGTADFLPRLISEELSKRLGQPVIIDNKPGAAGNIAAETLNNAEPDGYTIMSAPPPSLSINISLYPKLNYNPTNFVPIGIIANVPNALIVHPSLPVNTVQEFIAYAKAHPDELSYASQGSGSTAHLTAELFKLKTGTKMLHVPYKGDAPAITDLLAGHVNVMFGNLGATTTYIKSGKLKMLAVTSAKRAKSFPQVPTINTDVPGMVATTWFALVAPPKTPKEIAKTISNHVHDILKLPEIEQRMAEVGAEPVGDTPEEMAKFMAEDTLRWKEVIQAAKMTV